jgi:hypothetical protein
MADYRDMAAALSGGYGQDTGPITADTLITLKNGKKATASDLLGMLKGYGQTVGSNLESLSRGGVASVIGAGGDLESFARMGINKLYGAGGVNVSPTPVLPTSADILGMMPRGTATRPETAGMEELGGYMTPVTVKLAGKTIKATESTPVGKTGLPSPQSLTMPSVPTVDQMKQYGRTEVVPLSKAVSFQSARNWEKFKAGKGPGDLVAGYGDKPLALRLETGEYVIYDGNHRTDLALQKGQTELPMHVIDVKSYDPAHAGRKPVPPSMSDDELLKNLLGNN